MFPGEGCRDSSGVLFFWGTFGRPRCLTNQETNSRNLLCFGPRPQRGFFYVRFGLSARRWNFQSRWLSIQTGNRLPQPPSPWPPFPSGGRSYLRPVGLEVNALSHPADGSAQRSSSIGPSSRGRPCPPGATEKNPEDMGWGVFESDQVPKASSVVVMSLPYNIFGVKKKMTQHLDIPRATYDGSW